MPKRKAHLKAITGIDQERRRVTGIARAGGEGSSVKAMERKVTRLPGMGHRVEGAVRPAARVPRPPTPWQSACCL